MSFFGRGDFDLVRRCAAIVFCGGRATRLQSRLRGTPKALVRLERRPYLHGLLTQLQRTGFSEIILCVSPFAKGIIEDIRDGSAFGLSVRYTVDTGLCDNAGALWNARYWLNLPLALCINGDTLVDVDFARLLDAHVYGGRISTLVVSRRTDQPHPMGIEVAMDGAVVDIHEWAQDRELKIRGSALSTFYSNSGIYVFDVARLKARWPAGDRAGKLEEGLLRRLASARELFSFENGLRYLRDLGTPERLTAARSELNIISRFFTT